MTARPGAPRAAFEPEALGPSVRHELWYARAPDGAPIWGILYAPPGGADVAVVAMHPRGDFSRHYLAPGVVRAGYAFLGANSRYLNNDSDALHERLVLDVAGAVGALRDRGYRKVVLAGNSGGGSLFALYLEQAALPPEERIDRAPSGDVVELGRYELPPGDGLLLLAAHLGEGAFLLDRLDPSVVDEGDPVGADPRLDMYDPVNGYRPLERGPSRYAPEFMAEYRAGQRARCARLDRQALEWCEEAAVHRARLGSGAAEGELPDVERRRALRRALTRRYLVIYRTLADPRYLDPSLDPSPRPLGSIFAFGGRDPIYGNYGEGLARCLSARAWLSTWSGLRSRAALERTLPGVRVPTLIVHASADTDIHLSEARRAFAASGARDLDLWELEGADHYLNPAGAADLDPLERLHRERLDPWLHQHWPV